MGWGWGAREDERKSEHWAASEATVAGSADPPSRTVREAIVYQSCSFLHFSKLILKGILRVQMSQIEGHCLNFSTDLRRMASPRKINQCGLMVTWAVDNNNHQRVKTTTCSHCSKLQYSFFVSLFITSVYLGMRMKEAHHQTGLFPQTGSNKS